MNPVIDPKGAFDTMKAMSTPRIDATSKLGKMEQLLLQRQVLLANHISLMALELEMSVGQMLTTLYPPPEPDLHARVASLAGGLGLSVRSMAGILKRDGCIDQKKYDYLINGGKE